jgi:hypothetical protein
MLSVQFYFIRKFIPNMVKTKHIISVFDLADVFFHLSRLAIYFCFLDVAIETLERAL